MDHLSGVGAFPPDGYRPHEEAREDWPLPRIVLAVSSVAATFFSAIVFMETGSPVFLGFTAAAALVAGLTLFWPSGDSPVRRVFHRSWDAIFPLPSFWYTPAVRPYYPPVAPSRVLVVNHGTFAPSAPPIRVLNGDDRVTVGDHGTVGGPILFAPSPPPVRILNGNDRVQVGSHRPVGIPVPVPLPLFRPHLSGDDRVQVGDHRTVR